MEIFEQLRWHADVKSRYSEILNKILLEGAKPPFKVLLSSLLAALSERYRAELNEGWRFIMGVAA